MLREQFQAVAYRVSPYRHPIIGWMNDIRHLSLEDLAAWYERYYAPNNAILVVVGDIDPEAIFEMGPGSSARSEENFKTT